MGRQHHIIGDVHGCLAELQSLIEALAPQSDDVLVFVGDLLDKGPDSPGVVEYVMALAERFEVVLVEGNHEEKHRRFRKHLASGSTKVLNKMSQKADLAQITEALSEEAIAFLDTAVAYHQIPEHGVLVVHGGVPPTLEALPSERHLHKMNAKDRKHFGQLLRVRYVDAETGKMKALGQHGSADPFWAEVYDGRFGTVVYGHSPYHGLSEPKRHAHSVGVDLGAVFGGHLAAVSLPGFVSTVVKAEKAHAVPLEED